MCYMCAHMYLRNFFKVHVQKYIWAYYTVTVTYLLLYILFFMHVQNIIKLITLLCTIVCIQLDSVLAWCRVTYDHF